MKLRDSRMHLNADPRLELDGKAVRPVVSYLGKYYDLATWEAVFNQTMLAVIGTKLPEGSSPRQAMRVLRAMKTKEGHTEVLRTALAKLREHAPSVPKDAPGLAVAATFPALPG
jgi:hypothetical protein